MPIVHFGNDLIRLSRDRVLQFLRERKERNPGFRVLDVGGATNPWAAAFTDAYVDIRRFDTAKQIHQGDICGPEVWERIAAAGPPFDFSICTHVLEDVRDPAFVIGWLKKVSRGGFIAMPNKHFEFVNNESRYFTGCSHHRWIYTIRDEADGPAPTTDDRSRAGAPRLVAIAKLPIVQAWQSPLPRVFRAIERMPAVGPSATRILRRLRFEPALPRLRWLRPELGRGDMELNLRWEESFDFRIANDDYNGPSTTALAARYAVALDGVA